jgi:hypothetical protein
MSPKDFSVGVVAALWLGCLSTACSSSDAMSIKPVVTRDDASVMTRDPEPDAVGPSDTSDAGESEPALEQHDAGTTTPQTTVIDAGAAGHAGSSALSDAANSSDLPEEPEDAGTPPPSAADAGPVAPPPLVFGPDGCVMFVMPSDCTTPPNRVLPSDLRCTGLYGDWASRALACGVHPYQPAFELYSDGAHKQRWYSLPEGTHIDGTQPEGFVYPVGTQFWKEFRVDVAGESRLIETRLLRKISNSATGWVYTSYVWDEQAQNAVQTNMGALNVDGSDHDVPTLEQCRQCHSGRADFILGWDPIMLGPGATGTDLAQLVQSGMLENLATTDITIPGTDPQALALGYLHANCGISCHNPNGDAKDTGLFMRLDADKLRTVQSTPAFVTGFGKVPWENAKIGTLTPPADLGYFRDFFPFRADASLVVVRMQHRGSEAQMPPIATEKVDEDGVALIRALVAD